MTSTSKQVEEKKWLYLTDANQMDIKKDFD